MKQQKMKSRKQVIYAEAKSRSRPSKRIRQMIRETGTTAPFYSRM